MDLAGGQMLTLLPGAFGMLVTEERITLDRWHVGRFGLRSSLARRGPVAGAGPQVDPGFRGRPIVGLANPSPRPVAFTHLGDAQAQCEGLLLVTSDEAFAAFGIRTMW